MDEDPLAARDTTEKEGTLYSDTTFFLSELQGYQLDTYSEPILATSPTPTEVATPISVVSDLEVDEPDLPSNAIDTALATVNHSPRVVDPAAVDAGYDTGVVIPPTTPTTPVSGVLLSVRTSQSENNHRSCIKPVAEDDIARADVASAFEHAPSVKVNSSPEVARAEFEQPGTEVGILGSLSPLAVLTRLLLSRFIPAPRLALLIPSRSPKARSSGGSLPGELLRKPSLPALPITLLLRRRPTPLP